MDTKILEAELQQELDAMQKALSALQIKLQTLLIQKQGEIAELSEEIDKLRKENKVLRQDLAECKVVIPEPESPKPISKEASSASAHSKSDLRLIHDLRKAIGLNDRFRLRHDLFQNDDALMWQTIDALNVLETMQEADAYLHEHFSWDAENATVIYFYDMLGRKYYQG